MSTLTDLKNSWTDIPEYHQTIHEQFIDAVNGDPELKAHRDYVEQNVWGFGERSFWWLWKVLLDELPNQQCKLLEIGVFRGATLSLWRILKPQAFIIGVTPMDTSGNVWDSDYPADIQKIHDDFNLVSPILSKNRSESNEAIQDCKLFKPFDVVYIDGDHSHLGCLSDLVNYAPMVRKGGYLVIDDACTDMHMPWGYFQGIAEVTQATLEYIKEDEWEFITNVVHLRIYKKK